MFVTVREFALATGLSEWMVRKLCREGHLKSKKFGKSWRISARELDV